MLIRMRIVALSGGECSGSAADGHGSHDRRGGRPTSTRWTPSSRQSARSSPADTRTWPRAPRLRLPDSAPDAALLPPAEEAIARLETVPGVGRRTAEALVAELGLDLRRFPTAGHLASWAGMCPGNHESAGTRHRGKTRQGNRALRTVLVQAAHAAGHTKHTDLGAQCRRLAARRGKERAAVAVGHTILVIVYHLLTEGTVYHDLGPHYFDQRARQATERRLVRRLEALGYKVALEPSAA